MEIYILDRGGKVAIGDPIVGQTIESEKSLLEADQPMSFWIHYKSGRHITLNHEHEEEALFECAEDTYDAKFDTYEKLVAHSMNDYHEQMPRNISLLDYAINAYKAELEE